MASSSTSRSPVLLPAFDKYYYYSQSVQSIEADVEFIQRIYGEIHPGARAHSLREDFCGTFALASAWVEDGGANRSYGLDLDPEPLAYGKEHFFAQLTPEQQSRLDIRQANVLTSELPRVDIACALNFSYFIFKQREQLKQYFAKNFAALNPGGLFFLDCFGGPKCGEANEEETEDDELGYSYYWDQESYDPLTNEGLFYIHFKRQGEKKRERVFTYNWRLWSLPELRDILAEVGFPTSYVYWEGNDEEGDGNGEFTRVEQGEECDAWVAYIVAVKGR